MEYNQIKIKDPKSKKDKIFTVKEISWARDMALQNQCLNADHLSLNQTELWIARLHEATEIDDTVLRNMDRRTFETLIVKWMLVNDVDQASFLETGKIKKTK